MFDPQASVTLAHAQAIDSTKQSNKRGHRKVKNSADRETREQAGLTAHQSLAFPPLDFIRLPPKVTIFGADYVFPAPALAHAARRALWHGLPAAATDHPVPERPDRGAPEEVRQEATAAE